jgi:aspartyl-tRNA(Asn)/glutamyl-tRNA(Gln) amidotransferase subunit A
VAAGPDDMDRASLPAPDVCYEDAIESLDVRGLRATWSFDLGFAVVDPEVAARCHAAARDLVDAAGLKLLDRPFAVDNAMRTWLSAGAVDQWLDLEPGMWPERKQDFTGLVRAGLSRSESWTLPRFARALRYRQALEETVADLFRDVDILLAPATAVAAFAADGPLPMEIDGKDASHCGPVPFTMLANLCWNPAISVPAGLTADGLPVGLQIVGRRHADDVVLRLARLYEQARPWPRLAPPYR